MISQMIFSFSSYFHQINSYIHVHVSSTEPGEVHLSFPGSSNTFPHSRVPPSLPFFQPAYCPLVKLMYDHVLLLTRSWQTWSIYLSGRTHSVCFGDWAITETLELFFRPASLSGRGDECSVLSSCQSNQDWKVEPETEERHQLNERSEETRETVFSVEKQSECWQLNDSWSVLKLKLSCQS